MNPDGSLTRFENGVEGKLLVGVSASQLPVWKTLAEAHVASDTHDHSGTYVPLSGDSSISGSITATGLTISGGGTGVVKATSGTLSVGTVSLTAAAGEVTGTLPVGNGGTGQTSLTANQILLGNGSSGISSITVANGDKGKLLRYTTSGTYDWVSVGDVLTLPAINQLTCANSASDNYGQNDNQRVLFRNTAYNGTPEWRLIHESDIYGAPEHALSVLVNLSSDSVAEGGNNYSSSTWVGVDESDVTSTPKFLAAKTVNNAASLDFFSASELGLVTSIPTIKGLQVGEASTAGKVLTGNASQTGGPSWTALTSINTGLSAGPAKIDTNGKITSGAIALNGSEVTNTLPVGKGGTGATTLTGIVVGKGTDPFETVSTTSADGKFLKCTITNGNASYSFESINSSVPAITSLQSGTDSATTKVLTGGNSSTATPSWKPLADAGIAPTSHASTTTTYGAASATSYGHAKATTTTPKADTENGSLGSEVDSFARGDHAHPTPLVVEFAKRFSVIHGIGLTGAVTAEVTEYVGDSDAIIRVTAIDPDFITNAVPIAKGGTGATTASAALTNLGAAAASHKHALSDINSGLTKGGLLVGSSTTEIGSIAPVATGKILASKGTSALPAWDTPANLGISTRIKDVVEVHDGADGLDSSYHLVSVTAGHDTEVFVIAGANVSSSTAAYNPQIMLQAPTVDSGGDRIEISFISLAPASVTSALLINFNDAARTVFYKNNIVTTVQQHGGALTIAKGEKLVLNAIHYPTASDNLFWFATKQALSNI